MAYPTSTTDSHERIFSATAGLEVTPSDTVPLSIGFCRAIYVGGTGNIKVTMVGGGTLTFTGIPAGTILPVCATLIWATGTTATSIVAIK